MQKTTGSSPDLSLIIPCFNEAENVILVTERLAELLPNLGYEVEVIFVDGGSTDGTQAKLAERIANLHLEQVRVLQMSEKRGYGYDIMSGLKRAAAPVLSWTHADMQTDILDVFIGYSKFHKHSDQNIVVKGERKNRKIMEAVFTLGMQLVVYFALRTNLSDINAQPKIFSREFFETKMTLNAPDDFSLDLYCLYQAKISGYQITSIPVYFKPREFGEAKGGGGTLKNKLNLMHRTYKYIFNLRDRL